MARYKDIYVKDVAPALMKKFNYKSVMQIPKLDKIVINVGCGDAKDNSKVIDNVMGEIALITGQKPVATVAKKAVANFKQLAQDGIYGEETHGVLMRFLAGREMEEDTSAPAKIEKYVRVTGGFVNLRKGAGVEYDIITVVRCGMRLEWVATAPNGWYAVCADGVCGWLSPKFSEVVDP